MYDTIFKLVICYMLYIVINVIGAALIMSYDILRYVLSTYFE